MNHKKKALMLFQEWIKKQKFGDTPMLQMGSGKVTCSLCGTPPRICRSKKLRNLTKDVAKKIKASSPPIEGALYFVYRRRKKKVDPLYVGIARAAGKKGNKLSALVKNGHMRFGDTFTSKGHIGNLNCALSGKESSERHWVAALFKRNSTLVGPNPKVVLKAPVYVHFELWDASGQTMTGNKQRPNLKEEEAQRIDILGRAGYGDQLLNRQGNKARRRSQSAQRKSTQSKPVAKASGVTIRTAETSSLSRGCRRLVYLKVTNKKTYVKVVDNCDGRNNGLITIGENLVWLSLKLQGHSPSYLIDEIAAAGGDFIAEAGYTHSPHGAALGDSGCGYQGGVPFNSVADARAYLQHYFSVAWCP